MKKVLLNYTMILIILFILLCTGVYYLNMKSGYFVDEGMTLFLANGDYNGAVTSKSEMGIENFLNEFVIRDSFKATLGQLTNMLRELTTAGNYSIEGTVEWYDAARSMLQGERTWMTGEELFRQLTVSEEERFRYGRVFLNQAMDVHPPFYYLLVHTVFSLFPNTYSNEYLFGINIFFLLMSCLVLYHLGKELSPNLFLPFLATVIFGFSQGFASCSVYFRMYAVLTFFVILTVYIHFLLEKKRYQYGKKMAVLLCGTVILGFYTHYYYIIFFAPLFLITIIHLIKEKQKNELQRYIKEMVLSGMLSILIWPLSLYHILFSYRGTEASSNLLTGGLFDKGIRYYHVICKAFFYDREWIFWGVLILSIGIGVFYIREKRSESVFENWIVKLLIVTVFYIVIISQIAPDQSDRYIMCIYPFIALLISLVLLKWIERIFRHDKVRKTVIILLSGIIIMISIFLNSPNYVYREQASMKLGTNQKPEDMNCLMMSDDDWRGFSEALDLSRFKQVIVLGMPEIGILEAKHPTDMDCDMVIYVLKGLEQESTLLQICNNLQIPYESIRNINSDMEGFQAYLKTGQ